MIISRTCIEHKQSKRRCPIFTIDCLNALVVTGSYNGEVIVWQVEDKGSGHGKRQALPSFAVLQKIYDHKSSVLNARLHNEYLITTGDDNLCILYKQIKYGDECCAQGSAGTEVVEKTDEQKGVHVGECIENSGAQQMNDAVPTIEYKKMKVIGHHKADITSLHIKENIFFTAGLDGLIYMYDFTGSLLNYLDIRAPIKGLYTRDNRTFVKTDTHLLIYEDKTLKNRIVCDGILNESFFARMASFGKFMVVPSMFNNREDVVMLVSEEEILSLVGFIAPVEVVYVLGNILICGCQDKSVVLWRHEHHFKLRENLYENDNEKTKRIKVDNSKEKDSSKMCLVDEQVLNADVVTNTRGEKNGSVQQDKAAITLSNTDDENKDSIQQDKVKAGLERTENGKEGGVQQGMLAITSTNKEGEQNGNVEKDTVEQEVVDRNVENNGEIEGDNDKNCKEKVERMSKQTANSSAPNNSSKEGSPKNTVTVNKIKQGTYTRPLCLIKNLTASPILDITTYKRNVLFCSYSGEVMMVTFDTEQIEEVKEEDRTDVNIGKELLSITDRRMGAIMKNCSKDSADESSSVKCDSEYFTIKSDVERKRGRPKMCRNVEMEKVVLDEMMIGKRKVLSQDVCADAKTGVSDPANKKTVIENSANKDGGVSGSKDGVMESNSVVKSNQPLVGAQQDKRKRRITPVLIPQLTNYENKIVSVKNSIYVLFTGNKDRKVERECIKPVLMKMKEITVRISCGGSVEQIGGQKVYGDITMRNQKEQNVGNTDQAIPTSDGDRAALVSGNTGVRKERSTSFSLYTIDVSINDVLRYTLRYKDVRLLAFSNKYIAVYTNVLVVKSVISGQLLLPFIKQNVLYVDIKGDNLLLFMGDTFKVINLRKRKLLVSGSVPFDTYSLCFAKEYFIVGSDLQGNKYFFMKEIGEWCRINHEESDGFRIIREKGTERIGLLNEDGDGILCDKIGAGDVGNDRDGGVVHDITGVKSIVPGNTPISSTTTARDTGSAALFDNMIISQLFDNDDLSSLEQIEYSTLKKQSPIKVLARLRLFVSKLKSMTEVIEIRLENIFMNLVMNELRLDVIGILEEMKCTFPVFVYEVLGKITCMDRE